MRFRLTLLAAISLLISLLTQPTHAAVKAGSPCPKVGATSITADKRFTCTKAGKKLVWDKGVNLPKPSPVVIPSPAPTPTSSSSPSPSQSPQPNVSPTPTPTSTPTKIDSGWYAWNFRFNSNGILERRQNGAGAWSTAPTRAGQVINALRAKAFQEIKNYQISASKKNLTINFHFSPNVQQSVIDAYTKYFDESINFYSFRIPSASVLDVVIATEKDDTYRRDELQKILQNQKEANDLFTRGNQMFHQFDIANPLNSSGGGTVSGTNSLGKYIYSGAVCSCFTGENVLMYNIPHEVTHFYQFANTPTVPKQNFTGTYPNLVEGKILIPSSLIEGSANTFGSALTVSNVGWYSDMMDWHLGRYKSQGLLRAINSLDEAISLMKISESYLPEKTGYGDLNYIVGQLQYEYFIATYGMQSFFDLFDNIQKYGDFATGLQKTIGKNVVDFYTESAPYVMESYNAVTA